jgi:cytidylate kinase
MVMCIPKSQVVLAIYGSSCVGKSTLAAELGERWQIPVRHCGAVVKACATELGIAQESLPIDIHKTIDSETRKLAKNTKGAFVVEGAYLDLVLNEVPGVRFVHLRCNNMIRETRFLRRAGALSNTQSTLSQRDQDDKRLRRLLYQSVRRIEKPWLVVNTSKSTAAEMVDFVLSKFRQEVPDD